MTALTDGDRPITAGAYPYTTTITTRWMDNDMYGHVNNVQYYSFFDTVVTTWLLLEGGIDPATSPAIGLCVESQCSFKAPISFPEAVHAGLRVGRLGRSSVRYELVLFGPDMTTIAAEGYFVHVYVDREQRTPVPIPESLRPHLEELQSGSFGAGDVQQST